MHEIDSPDRALSTREGQCDSISPTMSSKALYNYSSRSVFWARTTLIKEIMYPRAPLARVEGNSAFHRPEKPSKMLGSHLDPQESFWRALSSTPPTHEHNTNVVFTCVTSCKTIARSASAKGASGENLTFFVWNCHRDRCILLQRASKCSSRSFTTKVRGHFFRCVRRRVVVIRKNLHCGWNSQTGFVHLTFVRSVVLFSWARIGSKENELAHSFSTPVAVCTCHTALNAVPCKPHAYAHHRVPGCTNLQSAYGVIYVFVLYRCWMPRIMSTF